MDALLDLFHQLRDVKGLIAWGGTAGLTAIIFAETGLLFGFFLPGDSLLVTAGLLAATTQTMSVWLLGWILTAAAIVGDTVGYAIGNATGPRLFARDDSLLFKKKHLIAAQRFYERHGAKAVVLARFVPIARTFVPTVAGMAQMGYRRYMTYNVVGAFLWIWSMLLTGYFMGVYIPGIDRHIEKVIIVVIFLSLLPGIISWWQARREARATGQNA
jgi:membrane-associated protein